MILKRITIQNIRSYVDSTSIDLPNGTILFQGDVGCGKSSILLSIEFALFGLGDLDGRHLLRNGKSKGSVELEFEANGHSYTIFRSLIKRSKNVVQHEGYIIEDGEKTDYSVSELKARILEIINIKERIQPKTTSIIYRFAIFTPQEMMKQVLTENQDRRLEILRRAFGIEEYNTVKKNITEIGIPWLKAETRTAKELSKDLLEDQTTLDIQKKRAKQISEEIKKTSSLLTNLDGQIKKFERKLDKLHKKKEKVVRLEESIPLLKNKILTEQRRTSNAKLDLGQLEDDLEKIKISEMNLVILKPKYEEYLKKKTLFTGLEESVKFFSKLEKEKIKLENTIERDKQYLDDKIRVLQVEIQENKKEIQEKKASIKILEKLKKKKESLDEKVKPLPKFRKQFQELSNKISKQDTTKRSLIKELEKKAIEINQINEIGEGAQCPKCRQKLSKEHIITVMSDFEAEKIQVNQEIKELEDGLGISSTERKKMEEIIRNLEKNDRNLLQISNKIAEFEERKKSISNLALKFQGKKDHLAEQTKKFNENDYSQIERKKLLELEQRMNELSEDVESYKSLKQSIEQYEYEEIELKYLENVQETKQKSKVEKEVEKISKSIKEIESVILLDTKELKIKQSLLERSRQVVPKINAIESEKKAVEKKCIECKTQIASKQAELHAINIHDLESEVSKKEQYFSNMIVYGQANNWMNECFIPIVEDIEQNVLSSINEEFNMMFQHWFNLLVEMGEITVEVDENFTPLITQGGYTLDVMSLSGGEKTSVALAYRLALNAMIKKTASFKSHLLILDEPTDGFSSEQLIRLRYVLDELDSSQIIMVSHEKELESFVSTIYRITKQNGISRVEVVT